MENRPRYRRRPSGGALPKSPSGKTRGPIAMPEMASVLAENPPDGCRTRLQPGGRLAGANPSGPIVSTRPSFFPCGEQDRASLAVQDCRQ
jgi:hypothetical protein